MPADPVQQPALPFCPACGRHHANSATLADAERAGEMLARRHNRRDAAWMIVALLALVLVMLGAVLYV